MRYFVPYYKPMQVVWYENKALVFASESPADGTPFVRSEGGPDSSPANLLQKFDNSNMLYVLSDDPEAAFRAFRSHMTCVEAAGGLVEDAEGRILMMFRKGRWDLPKGHVEQGETHEAAALREVAEETGLRQVRILGPLTDTRHCYDTYGRWELKRTRWYRMRCTHPAPPVPQREEGITEIEWMRGAELWKAVGSSYGTIRDVFDAYVKQR